ncbi:hypothetical protein TYRP_010268 [Tyrophagus putrescentiae]|nr:hypothetical protein TYRP_010268 [Tyrophagus putrescentiae]
MMTAPTTPHSTESTTESSSSSDLQLRSLLAHLFTVTLQQQIDAHRTEEQYSSLTGIYLFHIVSPRWSSPLFWTVDLQVGLAYEGKPRGGDPPLTTYLIDAQDLVELLNGRLNTAHAYLSGKLKLLGNTAAAFKFQHFINETLKQNNNVEEEEEEKGQEPKMNSSSQLLLSGIPTCGLKCDVIFELIRARLATESALVASVTPFVVQVNVLKDKRPVTSWTIDTRTPGGLVYRGEAATSTSSSSPKVDATLSRAFMKGLLKVKGNILLLQRLDQLWNRLQKTRHDPELPLLRQVLLETPVPGEVLPPGTAVRFSITKGGTLEAQWLVATDPEGHLLPVKHQTRLGSGGRGPLTPIAGPSDLELMMEDEELAMLTRQPQQCTLEQAIASRRVHATGDTSSLLPKLSALFRQQQPSPSSSSVLKAKL